MKKSLGVHSFLFRSLSDWKYWLTAAFLLRLILFLFQLALHRFSLIPGFWGATGGDTNSYLIPIENLVNNGIYDPDMRMPGYGFIYLLLISLFSKAVASNILICLQLILSAVSVYMLALITKYLFKRDILFYLVFYLFGISTFPCSYNTYLYTESFTGSFLIISTFYFVSYFNTYNKTKLFLSGLFLTWVIFLKPVFFLLLPFFTIILIAEHLHKKIKIQLAALYFLLSFVAFDGAWIIRNFIQHKKLLPLATSIFYPNNERTYSVPLMHFVQAWGGDYFWYYSDCIARDIHEPLPDYIYTSQFNSDSLKTINELVTKIMTDNSLPENVKDHYQDYIIKKCNIYTLSIKKEKPFLYYIKAPLLILNKFIIHSGNSYSLFNKPPGQLSILETMVNTFYYLFYLTVIVFGAIGILMLYTVSFKGNYMMSLIPTLPLYTIIIHAFIFRLCETRYFVPAYAFMLICAIYAVHNVCLLIKGRSSLS